MPIYLAMVISALLTHAAFSGSYSAEVLKNPPALGHGFSPFKMKVRKPCLKAPIHIAGQSHAELHLDYHLDRQKVKNEILGEVSHGVNLVLVKGKQSLKIRELFTSDTLQKSLIYKASYLTKTETTGGDMEKSALGKKLAETQDEQALRQNCGHEYVSKIHHGGTIYIAIHMTFLDIQAKQEVEHRIETSFLGLKKVIKNNYYSKHALKSTLVSVRAVQRGGDSAALDRVLKKHDTASCQLDQPDKCQNLIVGLLDYAVNTKSGFPSQLIDSPLGFETVSYRDNGFPELAKQAPAPWSQASQNALTQIADTLLDYTRLAGVAEDKQRQDLVKHADRHRFGVQLTDLRRNMIAVRNAAKACYRTPDRCLEEYADLKQVLRPLDRRILEIVRDTFWLCAMNLASHKSDIDKLKVYFDADDCDELADAIDPVAKLDVSDLGLESLRVLMPHEGLHELVATRNRIRDMASLALAPNLRVLNLRHNRIASLRGLARHDRLTKIDIAHNAITSVSAINGLPNIDLVNIYGNPTEDVDSLDRGRMAVVFTLAEACAQRLADYLEQGIVSQKDIDAHPGTIPHQAGTQKIIWKTCEQLASEL